MLFYTEIPSVLALLARLRKCIQQKQIYGLYGLAGTGKTFLAEELHLESTPEERFVRVACSFIEPKTLKNYLLRFFRNLPEGFYSLFQQKGTLFFDEVFRLSQEDQLFLEELVRAYLSVSSPSLQLGFSFGITEEEYLRKNTIFLRESLNFAGEQVHFFRLPTLSERVEDIFGLAMIFIGEMRKEGQSRVLKLSEATLGVLKQYFWKGNVKELRSVIRRGCLGAQQEQLYVEDLILPSPFLRGVVELERGLWSLAEVERRHILQVWEWANYNKTMASAVLQISRPTLDRKLKFYCIEKEASPKNSRKTE